MWSERLAALGAFLSGVGSVLSAIWFVRRQRKRADEECERRLRMLREGIRIGRGDEPNH